MKKFLFLYHFYTIKYNYFLVLSFFIICIFIIIFKKKYNTKKQHIYFYSIEPLKINYIIDTITNTFSYGFINNKTISIFISNESKNIPIIEYNIETQFNYHNIKLFLQSNDIMSFFINTKGILYGLSLHQIQKNDYIYNQNYLLIFSDKENKKYSTKIGGQIIEHIDIFYMQTILKTFLQKNS